MRADTGGNETVLDKRKINEKMFRLKGFYSYKMPGNVTEYSNAITVPAICIQSPIRGLIINVIRKLTRYS